MKVGNQLPHPPISSTRIDVFVVVIFVVALAVRLFLAYTARWPAFSDSRDYHVLARNLLAGVGYFQKYHGENPIHEGFTFYAYRMPGYPVFLALIYGASGFAARNAYIAQAILEVVGLILFWKIARFYLPTRAALISVFFLSANIYWTALLTTEVLFNSLILSLVCWTLFRSKNPHLIEVLAIGAVLAAAVFVRPVAILLIPVFVWRLPVGRNALVIMPLLALLTAWAVRNQTVLGAPVFLSTNSGWHNAPRFGVDRQEIFARLRAEGQNEAVINAELTHQIAEKVKSDPIAAAKILALRFAQMFTLTPPHEIEQFVFKRTFPDRIGRILRDCWYQFWYVYIVAALGVVCSWSDRQLRILALLTVATVVLHGFMSDGSFRFFAPWYFAVCLFAGAATDLMIQKCSPRLKQL